MNDARTSRFFAVALSVWAAGTLTLEPIAVAGMGATVLGVLVTDVLPNVRAGWKQALRAFWPLWAFVAWALVAPTIAGHPPSGTGVARTLDWVAVPVAMLAWTHLDARGRAAVVWTAASVLLVSCAVAGLQHYGLWPAAGAFEPLRFTRIPFERVYEPVPGDAGRFMGGGLAFHRLKFAHVGGVAALVLVAVAVGQKRALAAAAAIGAFLSLALFPYARAAIAALLPAAILVAVLLTNRRKRAFLTGGAAALLAVALIASVAPLRERFVSSLTEKGSGDRTWLLRAGTSVIAEHPLTGLGPGRFRAKDHAAKDAPDNVKQHTGKSHNQFVSMAAETGVPGALLFVAMLVALARRMKPSTVEGAFGLGALLFFVLLSFVHDPLFHAPFSMVIVLALGVGATRAPAHTPPASAERTPPS